MKQISIQITDETARQISRLASYWGCAPQRHNTAVIERAIATLYMLEIGTKEYQARLAEMGATSDYLLGNKDD
jgi:predicted transcriptional regulator